MLYWLYRHLEINLFQYITLRAGVAFFIALFLTLWLIPKFIAWAKSKSMAQPIYDHAPDSHKVKCSTPTMGGIMFLFSTLIATLLTAKLNNPYVVGGLIAIISFGFIGVKDDLSKIMHKKNEAGLSARGKFTLQLLSAIIISVFLYFYADLGGEFYFPFYKNAAFDMQFFIMFFWVFIFVGTSNAVNLTDGLDGLATVPSIFALSTLAIIAYIIGHAGLSAYLLLPNITLVGEVSIVASAFIGSLIGFLWYNCHPAQIFMGDTGSLSIGGFLAYMAIIAKSEVLLLIIGFIFVLETMSVILQVGSFKLRKKRVFLMAPIHHHFEMKQWAENKIIVRFWLISAIMNIIALISLKIR